ncbi:DoxX family protein [Pseudonocardia acidicola]|uniref:DoxX family protein n=1 Tax=Pseudonocardia acidicola TaxID=2724939 RepID=A0ABX1SGE8_9PSEU|nr:DoxX family protein [Pseudonocardia acidicola]NMH99558.1 DoxX family protein [Pseudonocardia acidicola]
MNVFVWILQIVLAVAFLAAGAMKLSRPRTALAASGMGYVEDFSDGAIKTIGALEVLAAIGLVLPWATGIAPVLTPLAALGLALIMIGAAVVHARRKENQMIGINVVLLILAALVAFYRF